MVTKVSKWLILEPLLFFKEKHLAELSRILKKPHTTLRKQLKPFEEIGLIKKEKKGLQTFYQIKKIPLIIDYLTIIEKERIIRKAENELILKEIIEFFHKTKNTTIIFGSAVNSIREAKDIDIIITGELEEKKVKEIEKKLNKKIHLIKVKELDDIKPALKEEIKKKHLIIQGTEEAIKWMIK